MGLFRNTPSSDTVDSLPLIHSANSKNESQQHFTADISMVEYFNESLAKGDESTVQQQRWSVRYSLRSHYDAVRAIAFHPTESFLITCSDDGTAKLWSLEQHTGAGDSSTSSSSSSHKSHRSSQSIATGVLDIEPVYAFRGHQGPVLAMDMSPTGDQLYTAGRDGNICCWTISKAQGLDIYDRYDPSVLQQRLVGHEDAIWALSYHPSTNRLISASADETIRVWNADAAEGIVPLVTKYGTPAGITTASTTQAAVRPHSIDIVWTDSQQLLVAYSGGNVVILDLETGKVVLQFLHGSEKVGGFEVNKVLAHPTMPIAIVAGDDCRLRYYDCTSGQLIHSTVAHSDAVSTLAVDPNGLYLLSGSHDGTICLWNIEKRTCLEKISVHSKKLDEGVLAVAFHPSRPLIGSAGADSLCKVLTSNGRTGTGGAGIIGHLF